jgi:hypothetical protein
MLENRLNAANRVAKRRIVTWLPMECRASSPGHDALDRTKLAQATGTATFVPFLPDFPQPSTALLLAFPRPSSG